MGRYLKYLEIVNKLDSAIEQKAAGRVDVDKDLPKIRTMLEVQKLALEMSMCIDRIDDNVKSSFRLYAKGDPSARGVVEEVLEKMKESGMGQSSAGGESASARGRDFRGGREDSESDRSYPARSWSSQGRADARAEMSTYDEEDRRGRRSRSEMYGDRGENYGGMDMQALFDRFNEEDRRGRSPRTGRFVHRAEMENDARNFFPLTSPSFPFGMNGNGRGEQLRMGFLGDGMSNNAPYNHAPMQHELENSGSLVSPLISAPNSDQSSAKAPGAAGANATKNAGAK